MNVIKQVFLLAALSAATSTLFSALGWALGTGPLTVGHIAAGAAAGFVPLLCCQFRW